jgi:hypothetical protein
MIDDGSTAVHIRCWPVVIGVAAVSLAGLAPNAAADATVVLGGGAGIIVNGTYCTLTTIGHDKTGALVGLTAATCGGSGAQVVGEGAQPSGTVGTVAASDDGLDYAVVKFDPGKVVPVGNFAGFPIIGFGPDPGFQQPICIQGGATGQACGSATVPGVKPLTMTGRLPVGHFQSGDEGAPVTTDGQLVGLMRHGRIFVDAVVPGADSLVGFTLISAVLNDLNAKGGPGAGFTPIPA